MAPLNYLRSPLHRANIDSRSAISDSPTTTQHVSSAQSYIAHRHDHNRKHDYAPRQLTLDISTPTRTSPQPSATSTTRRAATLNDLDPNPTTRAAPSIRTTRSDNPTVVNNLEMFTSTSTRGSKTTKDNSGSDSTSEDEAKPTDEKASASSPTSTLFTRTTTIHSSSASPSSLSNGNKAVSSTNTGEGSESESSILSSAVATTNLSWWQLLALIICGILALSGGSWLFFRHSQRKRHDKQQRKKEDMENELKRKKEMKDDQRFNALAFGHGRRGGGRGRRGRYESDDEYEDWSDEYSDGGIIRPSRRRRRRDRRRRRREYSDDETDRSVEPKSAFSFRPSPSPGGPLKSALTKKGTGRGFRDSVFSTYTSMKKAAIKHKYVEAKVKLDEQLRAEEKLENQRRMKVQEANREIDQFNRSEHQQQRKVTMDVPPEGGNRAGVGAHTDISIPIARPAPSHQGGGGGWGNGGVDDWNGIGTGNGPGGGANANPAFNGGGDEQKWAFPNSNRNGEPRAGKLLIPPVPRQPSKSHSTHEIPTAALLPYQSSPKKEKRDSLDGEISDLLGNSSSSSSSSASSHPKNRPEVSRQISDKSDRRKGVLKSSPSDPTAELKRPEPVYRPSSFSSSSSLSPDIRTRREARDQPQPKKGYTNPFQNDWLSKPSTTVSSPTEVDPPEAPSRQRTPLDTRHNRPKENTDTAAPMSLRGKGSVGFGLGEDQYNFGGGKEKKWANRLRERR
ncbi:hypothetical protein I302_108023 [Kwoniella bestiolae CBS 10118]|uniref:Uncharacterized protein n=1 Tax=Kwoniella bestiolae CBS 10118 TaxID=1296100 RepID=A0A1B9FWV8_9TREE|nr:hypothetical protein I302_07611 [Kwoniella bestiolae CBS 10118]OCF23257.1 hypothetical protein I302_07611 [Kwoniella bestiolae CBS 10118]